jgi:hypothetical protein
MEMTLISRNYVNLIIGANGCVIVLFKYMNVLTTVASLFVLG